MSQHYYREIAQQINPEIVVIRDEIEEFFSDVVFGFGNWLWKNDLKGHKVVMTQDLSFSDFQKPYELFNRENAISALKTASEEYEVDLSKECEYIKNMTPIELRAELMAVLYDVKVKLVRL